MPKRYRALRLVVINMLGIFFVGVFLTICFLAWDGVAANCSKCAHVIVQPGADGRMHLTSLWSRAIPFIAAAGLFLTYWLLEVIDAQRYQKRMRKLEVIEAQREQKRIRNTRVYNSDGLVDREHHT